MVLFFFILILIVLVSIFIVYSLSLKISINRILVDTKNNNFDYEIKVGLYLVKKIRIIAIKINKEKIAKIEQTIERLNRSKILKKLSKFNIEKMSLKLEKKLKKEIINKNIKPIEAVEIILKNLKIETLKFKMDLRIGLEDVIITSFLIAILSSILSIALKFTVNNIKDGNKYYYKILPIYRNENVLKLNLNCIINIKMVHIINIIYIFLGKKGRSDKNERTSNRRSYDYCHE